MYSPGLVLLAVVSQLLLEDKAEGKAGPGSLRSGGAVILTGPGLPRTEDGPARQRRVAGVPRSAGTLGGPCAAQTGSGLEERVQSKA